MRKTRARVPKRDEKDAVSYIAARLMGDPDSRCKCLAASGLSVADERGGRVVGGWVTEVHRRMIRLRTVTCYWPHTEPLACVSGYPF